MEMEICRWKHRTKKKIDDLQTINGSQNWNHMNLEAISITTQNISHEIVNNVKNFRKNTMRVMQKSVQNFVWSIRVVSFRIEIAT